MYTVQMIFSPRSELNDIITFHNYKVIPVTPCFSDELNQERQRHVIEAVKTSFEKLFPTDIMTIGIEDRNSVPKMKISYKYQNNPESLYYRVKEETLPVNQRTWYYGLRIIWNFYIYLPNDKYPIYEFQLISEPSSRILSKSFAADDVYSQMALSAFYDFKSEFYNRFINWDTP